MKKTYITPATDVVTLNVVQMLAASPDPTIDPTDPGIDPGEFDARKKNYGFGTSMWEDMK